MVVVMVALETILIMLKVVVLVVEVGTLVTQVNHQRNLQTLQME
jgi:uncharacterized membrane protein